MKNIEIFQNKNKEEGIKRVLFKIELLRKSGKEEEVL